MDEMALDDNFRQMVKRRRMELGLTQLDVSKRLGVSRAYVAQVEAGGHSPTLKLVEQFAKALECPSLVLLVAPEESEVAA